MAQCLALEDDIAQAKRRHSQSQHEYGVVLTAARKQAEADLHRVNEEHFHQQSHLRDSIQALQVASDLQVDPSIALRNTRPFYLCSTRKSESRSCGQYNFVCMHIALPCQAEVGRRVAEEDRLNEALEDLELQYRAVQRV